MKVAVALECPRCGARKIPELLSPWLKPTAKEPVFRCRGCGTRWGLALVEVPEARAPRP